MLIVLILGSVLGLFSVYFHLGSQDELEDFFFGVSYGQDTVEEARLLIDRVKDYTNVFFDK
ncbi:MAG: hypothetical protein ACOC6H_04855 [Thermoproteota archaeon]